ncbi:hypothetical protein [Sulfuricystis multivorans]|uniref:hypothetical protein n=1 Tax=Sulfuricystis multivorans TaxID=2211108 RepID=UPI000F82A97F|nr:hypothetical protein [Sulfuricystis multivorans]
MSRFRPEPVEWHVPRRGALPLSDPPRPGAAIEISVSDALARYWILDCPAGLASVAELDLYAAERFAALFGEDPARWVLRYDPDPTARAWLACALPAAVAVDLPRRAAERGWRPRRIQPQFVRAYNRHCRRLERTVAFCLAGEESTTIGLIVDGCWRNVRVHPPLDRSRADFATLLRRDCRQAGLAEICPPPVIVGPLAQVTA